MIAHALVLAAGLGTRLRPLTFVRAKPAVPVAGEPIVRRIIAWLARQHVTDLVLNLHHLPETITALVGDGSDLGVRVRYSWEQPEVLGSAGGPRHALPIIGSDTFFIVNGDTMTDLALEPLADAHQKSGALVTMALVPNREPDRYGGVTLTADGSFSGFVGRGRRRARLVSLHRRAGRAGRSVRRNSRRPRHKHPQRLSRPRRGQSRLRSWISLRCRVLGHRHAGRLLGDKHRVSRQRTA